jgi:DNA-binding NarL/FixJ family response regulator
MTDDREARRLVDQLTPRQKEVARLLVEGLTESGVARCLGCRPNTVDRHVQQIHKRFDCHCRAELVAIAVRAGLCDEGGMV